MDKVDFLKTQVPMCTKFPLFTYLASNFELYLELVRRSVDQFGENLLGRRCPKAVACTSECLGRPIPKYTELEPFIGHLKGITDTIYRGHSVWEVKAILCQSCPLRGDCHHACGSVEDFLNKHESTTEPFADSQIPLIGDIDIKPIEVMDKSNYLKYKDMLPWHVLNDTQSQIVRLRVYKSMDFASIALRLNISRQAVHQQFQSALETMKKAIK